MPKVKQRTLAQNRAIHKLFGEIADELNNRGAYISRIIRTDTPWNADRVKELIWRPTQETLFNTRSTTKLTTAQVDKVFEVIHHALLRKDIDIQFPSAESLEWEERLKDKIED